MDTTMPDLKSNKNHMAMHMADYWNNTIACCILFYQMSQDKCFSFHIFVGHWQYLKTDQSTELFKS